MNIFEANYYFLYSYNKKTDTSLVSVSHNN